MPWKRVWFKASKAYVRVDDTDRPIMENGRVEVCYKPDDPRVYKASPANIRELDDPPPKTPPKTATPAKKPNRASATAETPSRSTVKADGTQLDIWTDGACSGNPGDAGSGAVLSYRGSRLEISEYLGKATNNIAELEAIRLGLQAVTDPRTPVRLFTDSAYALGVLTKGWKAKKNPELVATIRQELARFKNLEIIKVKGHAGVPENERADELARLAVETRQSQRWRSKGEEA